MTLIFSDGTKEHFKSGTEVENAIFDKHYVIAEITAENNEIKLKLMEQQNKPTINWVGEEAISFF